LTTTLGVKRGCLEDQTRIVLRTRYAKDASVDFGRGPGQRLCALKTRELGVASFVGAHDCRFASATPFGLELGVEAFAIDVQARLTENLLGQLHGEPIGLIQVKEVLACNASNSAGLGICDEAFDLGGPSLERAAEEFLLRGEDLLDATRLTP